MVRGRGYLKGTTDLEKIVVKMDGGTPVLVKDIARVEIGPDERRGIAELNGEGEVASGIALQRSGANALTVIDNVKERLKELILFATSEQYFALRAKLGLAIDS